MATKTAIVYLYYFVQAAGTAVGTTEGVLKQVVPTTEYSQSVAMGYGQGYVENLGQIQVKPGVPVQVGVMGAVREAMAPATEAGQEVSHCYMRFT